MKDAARIMINYCTATMRCYRTPDWKLVRDFADPERDQLYHLAADPEETRNLIGNEEAQPVVATLHRKMLDQMRSTNDRLLRMNDRPGETPAAHRN